MEEPYIEGVATHDGPDLAHAVAPGRLLDLDQIGAEICQVHTEHVGSEERELEDAHSG